MTNKPFKTIDEQVDLLKARGLDIPNEHREDTKSLLLRSNYYDVVNGYSGFLQSDTNKFIPNSNFHELYAIYMYDKNIKSLFFRKIQKAEAFIRSAVAYYFCKNHQEDWAYLQSENFADNPLKVRKLFLDINKCIYLNGKHKNAISHYLNKNESLPLWVLINFFDFKVTRTFYNLMLDKDKIEITDYINNNLFEDYEKNFQLLPSQLDSYLENINHIRNIVAHDNRLLGFETTRDSHKNRAIFGVFRDTNTRSVFHGYLTLRLFLSKGQFENFTLALKNRTRDLDKKLNSIDVQIVLDSISFPQQWNWKQKNCDELF